MDYSKIIPINKIQPEVHIVNYFTLDKKRNNWGPRVIPDFEMILIREGTFTYIEHEEALNSFPVMGRIRGRVHISLEPGDLLIIPPGVNHTFKAEVANGAISCIHNQPIKGILGEGRRITISPTPLYSTDWSDNMDLINNLFLRCNDLFNGYHAYREELLGTICREIWLHCAIKWEIFFRRY